jgi:hypothetical protein
MEEYGAMHTILMDDSQGYHKHAKVIERPRGNDTWEVIKEGPETITLRLRDICRNYAIREWMSNGKLRAELSKEWQEDIPDLEAYERPITVILSCTKERMNEQEVTFLNIAEDIQGRDCLTFVCPKCGQDHTSFRFG